MGANLKRVRPGDRTIDADTWNAICDTCERMSGLSFSNDFLTQQGPGSFLVALAGATGSGGSVTTTDLSFYFFGFSFTAESPTIAFNGGYVIRGMRDPYWVAAANITLTADWQFVWIVTDLSAGNAYSQWGGPSTSLPQNTAANAYTVIGQFRLIQGAAALYRVGHVGNIDYRGITA